MRSPHSNRLNGHGFGIDLERRDVSILDDRSYGVDRYGVKQSVSFSRREFAYRIVRLMI
jgi:hypothetical protein